MRLGLITHPGTPPLGEDPVRWLVEQARLLGLSTVNTGIHRWREPDYLEGLRELLESSGIEILPCFGGDYVAIGREAEEVRQTVIEGLEVCKALGARIMWSCCASRDHHRFTTDPPVKAQIARIVETLKYLAEEAERRGIVMALENHLDYRGHEIAEVIERVGSPFLKASLDTANPFTVFEEPVEAAKVLAPYAVTVHFKDFRVVPWDYAEDGQARTVVACSALGKGHVDLETIVKLLWEKAPDPVNLPLNIELSFIPPGMDTGPWVLESIAYCRERFGKYLSGDNAFTRQ